MATSLLSPCSSSGVLRRMVPSYSARLLSFVVLAKHFLCSADEVEHGGCDRVWELDAVEVDFEDVLEVNLLQTHIALTSPTSTKLQARKPSAELAVNVTGSVVHNSTLRRASQIKDEFVHLLQTEFELLPHKDVHTSGSAAWMFLSGACIFTLLALWYEVKSFGTVDGMQDGNNPGSPIRFYERSINPTVAEIPLMVRDERWDFIRLVLICALIGSHLLGTLRVEAGFQFDDAMPALAMYAFSGLVFLSGMFSLSLEAKPVMMTLVGLPVTLFLLAALTWVAACFTPGSKDTLKLGRSMAECYLQCMFLWRITVSPLFFFFDRYDVPKLIPVMVVCMASWTMVSESSAPYPVEVHFLPMPRMYVPWQMLIRNAPFFAAGLMLTPKRWSELMDKLSLTVFAYVSLIAFALISSLAQHRAIPLQSCEGLHSLVLLLVVFASTFVIGSWLGPLKMAMPTVADHLVDCSRRCCQAFNFHWLLFLLVGGRLGFPISAGRLVQMGASGQVVMVSLVATWLTLVLSSRFAERSCGWLLNLPIKLVDFLSKYIENHSKAKQKAFEAFEPVYFLGDEQTPAAQKTLASSIGGQFTPCRPILSGA